LGRPGHQLTVQRDPVGTEPVPQAGVGDGLPELVDQLCLQPRVGEERPAGAGEDHAELTWDEPAFGRRRVATQYRHGPGPHVLFLAPDMTDTGTQVGAD